MSRARLQETPLRPDLLLAEVATPRAGGVTLYVGTVRAEDEGRRVDALTYEAYPEMAQLALERLLDETLSRFSLVDGRVVHRLGRVAPGEAALAVSLAGVHRAETFEAVAYFMDRLKREVPIWKREEGPSGAAWILGDHGRRVPVGPAQHTEKV